MRLVPLALAAVLTATGSPAPLGAPGTTTRGLALSHGRALYDVDSVSGDPVYLRAVPGGVPGAAHQVSIRGSASLGLDGPYVAWLRPASSGWEVAYGRVGGPYQTRAVPFGRVQVSGHRFVYDGLGTGPSYLVNIISDHWVGLTPSLPVLSGDYLTTFGYRYGNVTMRNVVTGAATDIRYRTTPWCDTCTPHWYAAAWGDEVAYSMHDPQLGYPSALYDFSSGTSTPLPMLHDATSISDIAYRDGRLLVAADGAVRLHDVRHGTNVLVDATGTGDVDNDGNVLGWRDGTQESVRSIHDFLPSYDAQPRYLTGSMPDGFGPGLAATSWHPRMYVTQDVDWQLAVHSGDASGPVVRTLTGSSAYGEITPAWDGTDSGGVPVEGAFTWALTGTTSGGTPLQNTEGTANVQTGTVYVSRTAPTYVPAVQTLSPLASTYSTQPWASWSWSVETGRYARVERSVDGGAYTVVFAKTRQGSLSYLGTPGHTYRLRVAEVDPAGRYGPYSTPVAVTAPYDDFTGTATYSGSWRGATNVPNGCYLQSYHASGVAGAYIRVTGRGTTFWLVGGVAPDHGQFQVSVDGGPWSGWYDTYAAHGNRREVLYTKTGLADATHLVRIRLRGTAGRPVVSVDAFGWLR